MDRLHRRVLERIVEQYDEEEQPVTAVEVGVSCAIDEESVRACFETLERNHLIVPVSDSGYRPTITARELLELDLDDDGVFILDAEPEE